MKSFARMNCQAVALRRLILVSFLALAAGCVSVPKVDNAPVAAPAMKIGGSDSINSILSGHWRKFAEEAGISATALRACIRVLCGETLKQTCGTLSLPSECDRVLEIVKSRVDKLIKTLA